MTREIRRCYSVDGAQRVIRLRRDGDSVRGRLDEHEFCLDAHLVRHVAGGGELMLGIGANAERAVVVRDGDTVFVALRGRVHRLAVADPHGGTDAHDTDEDDFAASPMTGVVLKVSVAEGDEVAAGARLFVVEAMKMEFVVEAPRDLTVAEVRAGEGDRVDIGQVLATFVPGEDAA